MSVCDLILLLSPCIAISSHEDPFEISLPKDPMSATVLITITAFVNVSSITFTTSGFMSEPESILPMALLRDLMEANKV